VKRRVRNSYLDDITTCCEDCIYLADECGRLQRELENLKNHGEWREIKFKESLRNEIINTRKRYSLQERNRKQLVQIEKMREALEEILLDLKENRISSAMDKAEQALQEQEEK